MPNQGISHDAHDYAERICERLPLRHQELRKGSGLTIGQAPWRADGDNPLSQDKLVGFTLAGEDQEWHDAEAKIEGNTGIISSPAVPFRSDDWPMPKTK